METDEEKIFHFEGSDVVVIIRDGHVERIMCSDPLISVTVINFGIGEEGTFHEARMFFYPLNEWDRFELKEIVEEYNTRYQYGRHIPGNNSVCLKKDGEGSFQEKNDDGDKNHPTITPPFERIKPEEDEP